MCPPLYTPLPIQSMDRGIPYYTLGFLCSKYRLILRELPESNSVIVTPVCLGISSFISVTRTQNLLKMYFWSSLLCTPSGVHPRFSYSFPWLSHICASHVTIECCCFFFFSPSCTCRRTGAAKYIMKSRRVQSLISHSSPSTFPSSVIVPLPCFSDPASPSHFHCSAPRLVIRDLYLAFSQSFHITVL